MRMRLRVARRRRCSSAVRGRAEATVHARSAAPRRTRDALAVARRTSSSVRRVSARTTVPQRRPMCFGTRPARRGWPAPARRPSTSSPTVGGLARRDRPTTTGSSRQNALRRSRAAPDRTVKTKRQPLGLALAAMSEPRAVSASRPCSPARSAAPATPAARSSCESQPVPVHAGLRRIRRSSSSPGAQGRSRSRCSRCRVITQYRVLIPTKPEIASPIVTRRRRASRSARRSPTPACAAASACASAARSWPVWKKEVVAAPSGLTLASSDAVDGVTFATPPVVDGRLARRRAPRRQRVRRVASASAVERQSMIRRDV